MPLPVQCINSSSMSLIRKAVIDWGLLGMLPRALISDLGGAPLRELDIPELVMRYALILVCNRAGTLPSVYGYGSSNAFGPRVVRSVTRGFCFSVAINTRA